MSRPNISYPQPINNGAGPSTYQQHQHPHAGHAVHSQPAAQSHYPAAGSSYAGSVNGRDGRRTSVQSVSSVGFRQPSGPRPGPNALDSSITRLLVVTKQLLQGLEQWAHGALTENDVSDVYVRLGDIFDTCITSFNRAGISTSTGGIPTLAVWRQELISIPLDLRRVLEEALAEDASQDALNLYLPTIRQIIYNLLDGLKRKQAQYKRSLADRQDSIAYGASSGAGAGGGNAASGSGTGIGAGGPGLAPTPAQVLAHSQSLGRLEGTQPQVQAQANPAGRQGSFGSIGAQRPNLHALGQSQSSVYAAGGLGSEIMEDDRLSVSARSAVSVNSYHSNTSNPNLVQANQQASSSSSNLHTKLPSAQSSRRASPSPTPDNWESRIPSTALAERERERAQRAAQQQHRPAPPDAFRPPRRVPSDGTAGTGTMRGQGVAGVQVTRESPQPPPNAPLPAVPSAANGGPGAGTAPVPPATGQKSSLRGVQLKDNGPIPSPPHSATSFASTGMTTSTSAQAVLQLQQQLPPAPPPKAAARDSRYSYNYRDRDSLGNPKPVSRFSADSDITSMTHGTIGTVGNGSPMRSPPSKSPPGGFGALAEHADESSGEGDEDGNDDTSMRVGSSGEVGVEADDGVLRSAGRMTFGQRIGAAATGAGEVATGTLGSSGEGQDGRASFDAGRDAPSLPQLDLPSVSLLDSSMSISSRAHDDPSSGPNLGGVTDGNSTLDLPPETKSSLAALRGFDTLERRASKRFSSYTMNKMLPSSPSMNMGGGGGGAGAGGRHARKPSGLGLGFGGEGGDSPQRPARRVQGGRGADGVPAIPPLPAGLASAKSSAGFSADSSGKGQREAGDTSQAQKPNVEGLPRDRVEISPVKSDLSTGSVKVLDTPPSARSGNMPLNEDEEDDDDQPLAQSASRAKGLAAARPAASASMGTGMSRSRSKDAAFGDLETVPESASTTGGADSRGSMTMPPTSAFTSTSTSTHPDAEATRARGDRETSVTPTHCSVYLQFGRQTKKAKLEYPITAAGIKMLFMERFEYDPGLDDFPEVYVTGTGKEAGVAWELEDMEDVVEGCVLSLNIEPLDQVKQHFDHTFASLVAEIKEMKSSLDRSRRISTVPASTAALLSASNMPPVPTGSPGMRSSPRLAAAASPRVSPSIGSANVNPLDSAAAPSSAATTSNAPAPLAAGLSVAKRIDLEAQQTEIVSLRRDLAIMRQLHSDFLSETKTAFSALKTQNNAMKEVINTKTGGSRALLDNSKTKLENASSDTITAVEEVQDLIDNAKDDAQRRFAIPSNATMKKIKRDLAKAEELVDGYRTAVNGSEQMWRATWAHELQRVMEEQKLFKYQSTLGEDLRNDVRDAKKLWASVEEFVNQRIASGHVQADGGGPGGGPSSATPRTGQAALRTNKGLGLISQGINFRPPSPTDGPGGMPHLLLEIRSKEAQDPHKRIKAIEAQARAREREKAEKMKDENEFADELGDFVNKKKLKKTGGTEEVERMRNRKQEVVLRRMITGEGVGAVTPSASRNVTPSPGPVAVKKEPVGGGGGGVVAATGAGAGASAVGSGASSAPVSASVQIKQEPDTPGSSSVPVTAALQGDSATAVSAATPAQTTPTLPTSERTPTQPIAPSVHATDPDDRPIKAEIDTPVKAPREADADSGGLQQGKGVGAGDEPHTVRDKGTGKSEAEKRLQAEHEEVFGVPAVKEKDKVVAAQGDGGGADVIAEQEEA